MVLYCKLESFSHKNALLESGVALSIEQIWIPFTEECFVPILIEIDPVFLEKKMLWAQISL